MSKYIRKNTGILSAALVLLSLSSCDKGYKSLNLNPDAVTSPTPEYMFSLAQYEGAGYNGHYGSSGSNFLMGTMQYTTSYNDVAGFGSKYITSQINASSAAFSAAYPDELNELHIVIKAVTGNASRINELAEARIWRVYCFSKITDLYGDIPYSQADQGYDSSNYKPVYDAQKDIYANMLSELDAAASSLDPSKTVSYGTSDLIYGGNPTQWKKFAYSLMLRLGMRMTKVDAASAQTWVTKAIAGGVITADADIAKMSYITGGQDINKNPLLLDMWNADYIAQNGKTNTEGGKYADSWINYLQATQDPRLPVISVVWVNGVPDTTSSIQKGMPQNLANQLPANFVTYSEPNPKTVLLLNAPRMLFTVAESNFLLAEAALRGWYSGATPASLYTTGVQAAMRQWSIIAGTAGAISTNQVNAYLANNPYNAGGTFDQQMGQIYTQFWVSNFPESQEVYNNYRRTGYPALVPNNYPTNATGGQIFRRGIYPISEQNVNTVNYKAAVARQGADDLMTRIWWDTK
ncbi:MAG TPA: SusD/RagB family nutrient-binding outer membrane lipoprotein [Puia sp.]|nr:SusD/RagB family nutrient-binding outer membrane lipoprotein [Puia sp.]